uniref:Uncharacterized protein n=1 Tax=Trypanosoma congolense (strain IL3000) TaxID=1068625 RepID=G0UNU1_TRYCI|nr:conserved hypothetical protein [Trypanosoma congolense IL3000]
MVVHVLLLGKSAGVVPTRYDLLCALRRSSERSYHATSSYIWTEENLFSSLVPVPIPKGSLGLCAPETWRFYAFEAHFSVGGNDEDVRVAVMTLLDLTAAVDDLAVLVTEAEEHDKEESDVLLVELADVIECSEKIRAFYLDRWRAQEHNYHKSMVGRVTMKSGSVFVVPLPGGQQMEQPLQNIIPSSPFDCGKNRLAILSDLVTTDVTASLKYREREMTEALHSWACCVARVMRGESWHLVVAAVPPTVAEVANAHPELVRAALLHHVVRFPLHWLPNGMLAPTAPPTAGMVVHDVVREYRVLIQNNWCVRIPLHLPRYIVAHFQCADTPPAVVAQPLLTPSSLGRSNETTKDESAGSAEASGDELLWGLQLTVALQRLRKEDNSAHAAATEKVLEEVKYGDNSEFFSGGATAGDGCFRRRLWALQRKVMPVQNLREHDRGWLLEYAREAERLQFFTDNEADLVDKYMDYESGDNYDSSSSRSDAETEDESEVFGRDAADVPEDGCNMTFSQQLRIMENAIGENACETLLGDSQTEDDVLREVASNTLFINTVHMPFFGFLYVNGTRRFS